MRCDPVRPVGRCDDMEPKHVFYFRSRAELRRWLEENGETERECWVACKRGRPQPDVLAYLDVVEEALCFGWIDSTCKAGDGGINLQRISPRTKNGRWSELNKERCRRLERLGLMTDRGRRVLPDMDASGFRIDDDVRAALQEDDAVWRNFQRFPLLYQRVRVNTVQIKRGTELFGRRLRKLVDCTRRNVMYGAWDDGGRLSDRERQDEARGSDRKE